MICLISTLDEKEYGPNTHMEATLVFRVQV